MIDMTLYVFMTHIHDTFLITMNAHAVFVINVLGKYVSLVLIECFKTLKQFLFMDM